MSSEPNTQYEFVMDRKDANIEVSDVTANGAVYFSAIRFIPGLHPLVA